MTPCSFSQAPLTRVPTRTARFLEAESDSSKKHLAVNCFLRLRRPGCVPSMFDSLGVKVPYPTGWRRRISETQGRHHEVASEGSVEQSRDLTNRNRIRGILGRTSGQLTAKSRSIKGQGCRSGRCVVKAIELTWGDLRRVPNSGLREPRGDLTATQKSAEGIVTHAVGKAIEALQCRKAEKQIGRAGNGG